ncbi:MAG: hypothetical protein JWL62_982, partial [Hyphomicrobiales bacterium]|nr:hypothetical protein [Hyphomicrobiales bacterium]
MKTRQDSDITNASGVSRRRSFPAATPVTASVTSLAVAPALATEPVEKRGRLSRTGLWLERHAIAFAWVLVSLG